MDYFSWVVNPTKVRNHRYVEWHVTSDRNKNMTNYGTSPGPVYTVTENYSYDIFTGKDDIPTGNSDVKITNSDGTTETVSGVSDGNILTPGNNFNLSIASALFGQTFIVVPGASGSITIAASLVTLTDNTFYIGGTANISILASVLSGSTLNVDGGTATLSTGTIASALSGSTINLTNGGTFSAGYGLISALNDSKITFGTGGGTLVVNAGGAIINLSSTTINNYNPNQDTIEFQDTTAPVSGYNISGTGTSRTITLLDTSGNEVGQYTANLASGVTLTDGPYNISDANSPLKITYSNGNTYVGVCFLSGSMISTPGGDVAVEHVNIGDEITAFDWKNGQDIVRPVVWVGKTHVNVRYGAPDDMSGYPIRILKDAISDGVPYKDMLITAEHSLFFDGKFIPARMLVNGRSIFYDKSITSYDYYHVETEQHSVITADGMLTESYLDTGNRHTFRQEGSVVAFTPSRNLTWDDAAAPLGVSREFAEPLFRQAEARAEAAGIAQKESALELTDDVNLHLVTDTGAVIRQAREHNGSVVFMLPTSVKSVRIASNASRPSDVIGPFVDDRRYFGIAVGDITMFEAGQNHAVTVHLSEKELDGWNTLEWEDTRWTSGNALLPLGERHPNSVALLAIQIKKAGPYLASDCVGIQSVKAG